jgi:hypothetical protein
MHSDPSKAASRGQRRPRRLDRKHAKALAVDRMTHAALWTKLRRELSQAEQHAGDFEPREAFYAVVRASMCADELYTRGSQLTLSQLTDDEFWDGILPPSSQCTAND